MLTNPDLCATTITPFCSCSSIPLFIGFTGSGIPLGVTFSFLISSPMVDLGSLVLLMSIFGWKVAVACGVTSMPALVINEQVVSMGKVLKAEEIENIFRDCGMGEPADIIPDRNLSDQS